MREWSLWEVRQTLVEVIPFNASLPCRFSLTNPCRKQYGIHMNIEPTEAEIELPLSLKSR